MVRLEREWLRDGVGIGRDKIQKIWNCEGRHFLAGRGKLLSLQTNYLLFENVAD